MAVAASTPLHRTSGVPIGRADSLFEGPNTHVEFIAANIPFTETLHIDLDRDALVFVQAGVYAVSTPNAETRFAILNPGSVATISAGAYSGIATAGTLQFQLVTWLPEALPTLDASLGPLRIYSACRELMPPDVTATFEALRSTPIQITEFDILAMLLRTIPRLSRTRSSIAVAPCPQGLPEQIGPLVASVRATPAQRWSLTEAAEAAGYSTFHFSRTFKQAVGCGFHEFVDRCRTEIALQYLSRNGLSPAEIWARSGFPSARSMRESIKDYLGLSVADLTRLREASLPKTSSAAAIVPETS